MANIRYAIASVIGIVQLAKATGNKELLEVLFPHEDAEEIQQIYDRPDLVEETTVEVEIRSID